MLMSIECISDNNKTVFCLHASKTRSTWLNGQLNRCQSNMLSAIFHATSPTPKQIHPTLQRHSTSYTKKPHPPWRANNPFASFKRRRPRRQKEAWSSSRTETDGKFPPWNSSTFHLQPWKWRPLRISKHLRFESFPRINFVGFLWGSNDSLSIKNLKRKSQCQFCLNSINY